MNFGGKERSLQIDFRLPRITQTCLMFLDIFFLSDAFFTSSQRFALFPIFPDLELFLINVLPSPPSFHCSSVINAWVCWIL